MRPVVKICSEPEWSLKLFSLGELWLACKWLENDLLLLSELPVSLS